MLPILEVKNLTIKLSDKKIIENVSFDIKNGEVLALIGPNGAGKSVLLKALVGLIKPASGEINWKKNIRIGYLPQRFNLDYYLPITVKEFFHIKKNIKNEDLLKIIKEVGLRETVLSKNISHLSGGELQKVLLAWAIIDHPQILLFDEPIENVDIISQKSIYNILRQLQVSAGVAIIIVSHDLDIVYKYAQKVICLNQKMMCYGSPHQAMTPEQLSELYQDKKFFHSHLHNH